MARLLPALPMPEPTVSLQGDELAIRPPPGGPALSGTLQVAGDKSISHRALMLGAIAEGETRIRGLLLGEDPRSTARCFRALGATIGELNATEVAIQGVGLGQLQEPETVLDAGNAGTTLRLMLGLLAAHPERLFVVTGDRSLRSRPMDRAIQPLQQMGACIWGRQHDRCAPLAVRGRVLQPIGYRLPVASAQLKSCLLLAGLMAPGTTTAIEPAQSRDHTERMLRAFGATVETDPERGSVTVAGPARLRGQMVVVPGDISSAAFWLVAGAIVPGADLRIENVGVNPTRTGVLEALAAMEARIELQNQRTVAGEPVAEVRVRHSTLRSCRIAGEWIPRAIDEIPVLAVAAAFARGTTVIADAAELRVKESDRLAVMAAQLNRMGAQVSERADGLEIAGGRTLEGAELDACSDHRVAMSLAVAALGARGDTRIRGAESIAVSYPEFVSQLQQLCGGGSATPGPHS